MSNSNKIRNKVSFHFKTIMNNYVQICNLIILVVFCFILTSCSEYLVGKPNKPDYVEIKSNGKLACLDNVKSDMQKFLDSEGSNSEIDQTITCINDTLTELQTRIQGSVEATSYTVDDIYKILSKFASQTQISQVAAQNMISLKAALLGGDSSKITKNEINILKNYLVLIGDEAKKMRPYIKLFYFTKSDRVYTKTFIKEGTEQLKVSLKNLYKASQLGVSNYSFENFRELLINVLNLGTDKKTMVDVASRISSLLGGIDKIVSETDRFAFIDNVIELLNVYSLYVNGYAKFEISTSSNLKECFDFVDSVINLVENSLQYKKTQMISVQTLDGFVGAITKSNFLSYPVTGYTLAMFYRTLLVRVFESGAKGSITGFMGLNKVHLRNIKRELAIYKVSSKLIERVASEELFAARGISSASLIEIQQALASLDISKESEILGLYDSDLQNQIINNVNQLRSEFVGSQPVIYHHQKLGEAINQDSWSQNWSDLARGLYVKILARLIMQGWGQIYPFENISTNYLTSQGMANWFGEFKHLGIEIKTLDPRSTMTGFTISNAANLFTRSGNGDQNISYKELVESLGISLSSSGRIFGDISEDLKNSKCNLPELDIFDNNWNYESCLYQVLRTNYKEYFSNLPHLIGYLDTLSFGQFKSYFEAALGVARIDASNAGKKVETSDLQSMNSLLYFVENVFITHDANSNGLLSESEIRQAYPKFASVSKDFAYKMSKSQIEEFLSWKGDLAGYGCYNESELLQESFVFLIYNGRTPTKDDFNTLPCFRDKPLLNFSGEVDRRTLINTFKFMKSVL